MKIRLTFLFILFCASSYATDYFVRMDGSDKNTGTSNTVEGAWQTMDYALSQLKAGDHLFVGDGTYVTKGLSLENIHGTPEKITRISAIHTWKAVLTEKTTPERDAAVLKISNCSYVEIDGFEVYDEVDTGVGIAVRDSSHHVTVKNCYIHDCGCNGIASRTSDYLIFENNVVRDNAKRNKWNCSGLTIWHPIEYDQEPGYHIIVRKNVAFENECDLPFTPLGFKNPTDGNGIIIDDFRNTQGGGQEGGYKAKVLVENNLSFNNGGRGINVYESDNVTVRNNTTYHNLRVISKYMDFPGEITISNSKGSRVYNNLMVKQPGLPTRALRCYDNDSLNTKIFNNIIIGPKDFCGQIIFEEGNVVKDISEQGFPKFRNPDIDVEFASIEDFRNYFGLSFDSPLVDTGICKDVPNEDRDGSPRPSGKHIDIGCYEHQSK